MDTFRGKEIYLEGRKSIWRERNVFRRDDADFERTKYISMERNNISEFPHVPLGVPYLTALIACKHRTTSDRHDVTPDVTPDVTHPRGGVFLERTAPQFRMMDIVTTLRYDQSRYREYL